MAAVSLLLLVTVVSTTGSQVVATVNNQPVLAAEVEWELRQAYGDRKLGPAERDQLFAAALEQAIDRRLVLQNLTKAGVAASQDDVAFALAQFEKELAAQNLTLTQHCEKVGLTPKDIERNLAWRISWKRYCTKYLTTDNLEKFFERNRRDFDGTQLRVAQILLPLSDTANPAEPLQQANKLREEIRAARLTFADAARQHSTAPSRETGGDIGWIERHHPMPEDFSKIAFALKKTEVSQPFASPFGVHLVTVLDEKPGAKTWQEVQDELRPAVVFYLFRWIADRERATAKIDHAKPENP